MSPLPQRKKTPEELARLREEMGHPSVPPSGHPAAHRPGHPPVVPTGSSPVTPAPTEAAREPDPPREAAPPKPVRSLRRSEREPAAHAPSAPASSSSGLPSHRHSERELDRMRQVEASRSLSGPPPGAIYLQGVASPILVIFGYLLALAGGIGALPIIAFIAWKKPLSRHHAGFMGMIAGLVIVFGLLYNFPNLNPAHAP